MQNTALEEIAIETKNALNLANDHLQEICSLLKRLGRRFTVSDYTNPSGSLAYRVSGRSPDGKQVRRNFGTYAEAVLHCAALEMQAIQVAGAAALQAGLTGTAQPKNILMLTPTEERNDEPTPAVEHCTVEEAVNRFLEDAAFKTLRSRTQCDYRSRLNRLKRLHGKLQLSALSAAQLKAFCWAEEFAPKTVLGVRKVVSRFMSWSFETDLLTGKNPIEGVPTPKLDMHEPEVIPLPDVKHLLLALLKRDGSLRPFIALTLFAGLRPAEARALSWSDIKLDENLVIISGKIAKCRSRRVVKLSENAVEWLRGQEDKPINPPSFQRRFAMLREEAGIEKWVHDGLRHTALSHRFAAGWNESEVAAWAGNSPDILHRHYRGLVTPKEAEEFWSLTPKSISETANPTPSK